MLDSDLKGWMKWNFIAFLMVNLNSFSLWDDYIGLKRYQNEKDLKRFRDYKFIIRLKDSE